MLIFHLLQYWQKNLCLCPTKKGAFFELYNSSATLPFIFSSFHYEMQALDLRATLKTGVRFSVFIQRRVVVAKRPATNYILLLFSKLKHDYESSFTLRQQPFSFAFDKWTSYHTYRYVCCAHIALVHKVSNKISDFFMQIWLKCGKALMWVPTYVRSTLAGKIYKSFRISPISFCKFLKEISYWTRLVIGFNNSLQREEKNQ